MRLTYAISFCGALLLAPATAVAQDNVPPPAPKQDSITLRAVDGTFKVTARFSPESLVFIESCEPKKGYSESNVQLALPLEIEASPNDSLERLTTLLRAAVDKGSEIEVEPSGEPGQLAIYSWAGDRRFQGVIAHLSVKYTMFLEDGTPVRATASLAMKQAQRVTSKKQAEDANTSAKKKPDCSPKQQ